MMVQFLHPGTEHGPDCFSKATQKGWKDWNHVDHRRKFLIAGGSWTPSPRQNPSKGRIALWGEWEPQSEVSLVQEADWFAQSETRIETASASDRRRAKYPKWLHIPHLRLDVLRGRSAETHGCCDAQGWQNTDPLVFGDRFRYTICGQLRKNPIWRQTLLAQLEKDDIILFGSCVGGEFALDTVLVVGLYYDLGAGHEPPEWDSDLHKRITLDLIQIPPCGVRLYGGATWAPDRPFSFVPCRPVGAEPMAFPRPVMKRTGPLRWISPRKTQGFTTGPSGMEDVRRAWDAVVEQVLRQGCVLGTSVDEIDDESGADHL
jgi:hypothetical protein